MAQKEIFNTFHLYQAQVYSKLCDSRHNLIGDSMAHAHQHGVLLYYLSNQIVLFVFLHKFTALYIVHL